MEYTTVDHLGNTRLSYADLNGNGIIETPSEILDEVHYYPNGLKMEGYWMNSDNFRYTFNGIEEIDDFGLGVNMATFRTLDPELGRWWSVDPQATHAMNMNPYNSMYGSPMVFNDPNGDCPMCIAALVGAGVGGVANLWDKRKQINNGWDFAAAFGIGALGGATTGAIGFASGGAGLLGGAAYGAASGISGDLVTQIGNGLYFGDSYNGNRTLAAGALGGVIGGITGALTVPNGANPWTGKLAPTTTTTTGTTLSDAAEAAAKSGRMTVGGFSDDVTGITGHSVGSAALPDEVVVTASRAASTASSANSSAGLTVHANGFSLGFQKIKDGFLLKSLNLRIQSHKHFISPIKGRGATGAINASHLNINKLHIIYNPKHWKYLSNYKFLPFRF